MASLQSFAPVSHAKVRTLILGSMPGKRSLMDNQYYAHPRNAFWPLMATLLQFELGSYSRQLQSLLKADIALWDVLQACDRASSLDADIIESSIVPNDFTGFLDGHKNIVAIYFNGAKAEQMYKRHVLPNLSQQLIDRDISTLRLPSTSPAHASKSFEQKLDAWRVIID